MRRTFTLPEIKQAWGIYEKLKVLRVQKDGKWETRPLGASHKLIPGTRAMVKDLSDVMDFPEYLETLWPTKASTPTK